MNTTVIGFLLAATVAIGCGDVTNDSCPNGYGSTWTAHYTVDRQQSTPTGGVTCSPPPDKTTDNPFAPEFAEITAINPDGGHVSARTEKNSATGCVFDVALTANCKP